MLPQLLHINLKKMSPITHWQVGSFLANARSYNLRERRLIMLAALVPDVDGIFIFDLRPEGLCLGMGENWARFHHTFSHNVFFCLFLSLLFALYNRSRRLELFAMCSLSSLLHILLDVLTNDPSWSQQFLRPLTDRDFQLTALISWPGLPAFQVWVLQPLLMVLIFAGVIYLYIRTGRTFLELLSPRLDTFITNFITFPFSRRCVVCGGRAFYQSSEGQQPLCPIHSRFCLRIEPETVPPSSTDHD